VYSRILRDKNGGAGPGVHGVTRGVFAGTDAIDWPNGLNSSYAPLRWTTAWIVGNRAVDSLPADEFAGGATGAKRSGAAGGGPMGRWLFKEEPTHYNFADLERDGTAVWDGVANALAQQHLRKVRPGDRVFYYHTGKEKAVVGEMKVIRGPEPNPDAPDEKQVAVIVKAVRRLQHPVPLGRIKADPAFKDWELVRLPRLSVMPVTDAQWQRVEELGRNPGR
jgi:predicted RNA-binding protein with PUA-like domain